MELIDERFKDAPPEETISKIRSILSQNGISVTESDLRSGVKNCHSMSISINGTNISSNGKGVTPVLARASAHAELIERLQAGRRGYSPARFADQTSFDPEELLEHCGKHFADISRCHPGSKGDHVSVEEIVDFCFLNSDTEKCDVLPYYNVMAGEMTYYPVPLTMLYFSTGLAAGNTPEEAMVQGMSEIFERNSKLRLMREKLVPPIIPEDFLEKYPETYETIQEIRKAGYDVTVRDCSLGKPFPVLAAVLINKKTHCYHVHMGSHPIFEIALRRTLTETFQGRSLANVTTVDSLTSSKNYSASGKEITRNMRVSEGTYPVEFFGNDFSFEFVPYKDRRSMTNKELLKEIVDYIASLGHTMLVRNHSCLGFPTYRIIIPGYSEARPHWLKENSYFTHKKFYSEFPGKYSSITADRAKLRLSVEHKFNIITGFDLYTKSFAPILRLDIHENRALYLLNLAYLEWAAGNKQNAAIYLDRTRSIAPDYDTDFLHCLKNWIKLDRDDFDNSEICSLLSPFYEDVTLQSVYAAMRGNPFAKYAHTCEDCDCTNCPFKEKCPHDAHLSITNMINDALQKFDDKAAFAALKKLFSKL